MGILNENALKKKYKSALVVPLTGADFFLRHAVRARNADCCVTRRKRKDPLSANRGDLSQKTIFPHTASGTEAAYSGQSVLQKQNS